MIPFQQTLLIEIKKIKITIKIRSQEKAKPRRG